MTYQQESYEGYSESGTAPTLKASGGNYGGGDRSLDPTPPPVGVDFLNDVLTERRVMTVCAAQSDHKHLPCMDIPYTLKIRGGCAGGVREL